MKERISELMNKRLIEISIVHIVFSTNILQFYNFFYKHVFLIIEQIYMNSSYLFQTYMFEYAFYLI